MSGNLRLIQRKGLISYSPNFHVKFPLKLSTCFNVCTNVRISSLFNQRIYICRMTFAVAKGIEMELAIPGIFQNLMYALNEI